MRHPCIGLVAVVKGEGRAMAAGRGGSEAGEAVACMRAVLETRAGSGASREAKMASNSSSDEPH